ncbi:alpha/beta hydrolase-fold protein [Brevibacillus brevis]|nr:alpha/beta hydrolase-fold protein [Brevibacillus brevis]
MQIVKGQLLADVCHHRALLVYLPPSYDKSTSRFPVMYVHDGGDLFDPAFSTALDVIEDKFAEGKIPELILVGIQPGNRRDDYTPWFSKAISSERNIDFGGQGDAYLSYVANECKAYIDSKYRTDSRAEKTGIIGFSLGGLISMYAAYQYPDVFTKIGSISGSYWYEGMVPFMREKKMYQPGLRIYMDVGSKEGAKKQNIQKQMVPLTKEAHQILADSGFTADQLVLFMDEGADHLSKYANARFPGALQWLWNEKEETEVELTKLIRERRSIHRFTDREVDPALVTELMDTAVWAPNYHMTQPWRFIVTYGEGKKRIAEAVRIMKEKREIDPSKKKEVGEKFYNKIMAIPMLMTVIMEESPNLITRQDDFASTSIVIHNFSLLAWEKGIGLTWETYPWIHEPEFRESMGIRPGEKVLGNLHIGYPAAIPNAQPRIPAAERITLVDKA